MYSSASIRTGVVETSSPGDEPHLYEMLIRDDPRLDALVVDDQSGMDVVRRLLEVSLIGFLVYGAAVGLALQLVAPGWWLDELPTLTLPLSLIGGNLLALIVCLPSFYFYTQLSGLDASFRLITAQALRVQARTAVLLLGALPFYIAVVLATRVGVLAAGPDLPRIGIVLPFLVGLAGLRSLYKSFARLALVLPIAHARRAGFLSRMVLAWAVAYSVICPVALWRVSMAIADLSSIGAPPRIASADPAKANVQAPIALSRCASIRSASQLAAAK